MLRASTSESNRIPAPAQTTRYDPAVRGPEQHPHEMWHDQADEADCAGERHDHAHEQRRHHEHGPGDVLGIHASVSAASSPDDMTSSDRDRENSQPQPATESTATARTATRCTGEYRPEMTHHHIHSLAQRTSAQDHREHHQLENRKLMMTPASTSP